MSDELTLEAAVEILNRGRWRDRNNWRIETTDSEFQYVISEPSRPPFPPQYSLDPEDAIAIAKGIVAEKRIKELERENADYAEYMHPLLKAMNVTSPCAGVEWVRIVLEQRDTAQQERDALQQDVDDAVMGCIRCQGDGLIVIEGHQQFCICPDGQVQSSQQQLAEIRRVVEPALRGAVVVMEAYFDILGTDASNNDNYCRVVDALAAFPEREKEKQDG